MNMKPFGDRYRVVTGVNMSNEIPGPNFHVQPGSAAVVFHDDGVDLIPPEGFTEEATITEGSAMWYANGIMLLLSDPDGIQDLSDLIELAYEKIGAAMLEESEDSRD